MLELEPIIVQIPLQSVFKIRRAGFKNLAGPAIRFKEVKLGSVLGLALDLSFFLWKSKVKNIFP